MSNPIFTPKKAFILVPGEGVIEKANFTQAHAKKLLKNAEANGVKQDVFIKQHFEMSVGDLPLFEDEGEMTEEQLAAQIEAEEK